MTNNTTDPYTPIGYHLPAQELLDHPPLDPIPGEPRTDLGYAQRFVKVHGHEARYVNAWNQWLVWDDSRWATDTTSKTKRWMKAITRNVTTDTYRIRAEKERDQALREAKKGESNSAVNGSLQLASVDASVVVHHEDLDAKPWLLNCGNGTFNLRTGQLQPHNPTDLLTRQAGADYYPDARGEVFEAFLERIQPDPAMRKYLGRLLGHTLVGELIEHVMPIFYGEGANGKSTLLDAVLVALGGYAGMAAPGLLTAKTFDAHPTEIADLFGLRLARLDETDDGRRLAEGTVKRLTGDRRQKARRMRENFWEFDASHTFIMLTNHKPLVSGTDEGIWRRLRLVPFEVIIPKEDRDEELPRKLAAEADAVLTWLADGCRQWQDSGLAEPDPVLNATAAYRADSDAVGRFLTECCWTRPGCKVQSSLLFDSWEKWCDDEGAEPGTKKSFAINLQNRGYDTTKSNGRKVWTGIGLTTESDS